MKITIINSRHNSGDEINENWYNETNCSALPYAKLVELVKILSKLVQIETVISNEIRVYPHLKPEICTFLRKRLVRELGKANLSELFKEH